MSELIPPMCWHIPNRAICFGFSLLCSDADVGALCRSEIGQGAALVSEGDPNADVWDEVVAAALWDAVCLCEGHDAVSFVMWFIVNILMLDVWLGKAHK